MIRALPLLLLLACDSDPEASVEVEDARPDALAVDAAPDAATLDAAPEPDLAAMDAAPPRDARLPPDLAVDAAAADAAPPLTEPLPEQPEWGPMGRVTYLEVPLDANEARRKGCVVAGPSVGTGVRNLLALAGGGLARAVRPNAEGRIETVVLVRTPDWPVGVPATELERLEVQVLQGLQGEDPEDFFIAPNTFEGGDAANPPRVRFPDTLVEAGWIETTTNGDFILPISLLGSGPFELRIQSSKITGRLATDTPGLRFDHGIVTGYLTDEGALQLIHGIQELCAQPDAGGVCQLLGGQIDQPAEALLDLVVGIIGGFELRYDEGRTSDCDPEAGDCNAVGLCAELQVRGVPALGPAE